MSVNFDVEFIEQEPFETDFSSSSFTAGFPENGATPADVWQGKKFIDALGFEQTGTYLWDFKGSRSVLIEPELFSYSAALKDTDFNTWTPSTTASIIVPSTSFRTYAVNMAQNEYLLHWRCTFDAVYQSGTTKKAAPLREIADIWQAILRRPNSVDNIIASNFNGNGCVTMSTTPLHVYYNSSGNIAYTYSISYGIYPAAVAATFSSSTSDTPTLTIKSPSYSARCSSTYMSTSMAGKLDKEESKLNMKGELWRVPVGSVMRSLYDLLIDLYNNPITEE